MGNIPGMIQIIIFIIAICALIGGMIASFYVKGTGFQRLSKWGLSIFGFGPVVIYDALYYKKKIKLKNV